MSTPQLLRGGEGGNSLTWTDTLTEVLGRLHKTHNTDRKQHRLNSGPLPTASGHTEGSGIQSLGTNGDKTSCFVFSLKVVTNLPCESDGQVCPGLFFLASLFPP